MFITRFFNRDSMKAYSQRLIRKAVESMDNSTFVAIDYDEVRFEETERVIEENATANRDTGEAKLDKQ